MSSKKWEITKTVNVSEFDTGILVLELFNRVIDHMEDPEPKHDLFLEQRTPCEKLQLKEELRTVIG